MKKFYVNFITSSILYNQIHCTDKSITIKKDELKIRYEGYDYKNTEDINIDKNKEIDINFIKDLVKNKKLKDNKKTDLKLDEKGNYEIKFNDKKEKYYINDFLNKKADGKVKGYYIKIQKYYILPKESNIFVAGYSADLEGQKVYLDDFKFESQKNFIDSVFKKFKSLKLENKDYNPKSIEIKDQNSEDYCIQDTFYEKIKNEKYDEKKKINKLDKGKFKKLLDDNSVLNISIYKYKKYKIKSLELDKNLSKKYKITKKCKKILIGKNLTFKDSKTTEDMCEYLKKNYIKELGTININNKYLRNNTFNPISDNNLDIVITNFFEKNATNIVPKKSKIIIDSK